MPVCSEAIEASRHSSDIRKNLPDSSQHRTSVRGDVFQDVVYTRTSSGHPLRRPPFADQRRHLLARFYEPHHAALTSAVEAALAAHGTCLLLGGHTFPTRPQPYEDDQDPDRADICIGTDTSHTPAWLRDTAVRTFEELGWSVAVDRPFAGALVPRVDGWRLRASRIQRALAAC